jgi:hypothetical protein
MKIVVERMMLKMSVIWFNFEHSAHFVEPIFNFYNSLCYYRN